MSSKGSKILFGITLATMMIPSQLIFLPVYLMFSSWGMINTYWSLILPSASSAFAIFMLRQTFKQVSEELLEAARLDKAGEFKIIWKIMLPLARPTVVTLAMLTFISVWNDYFWPLVMTTKETVRTLPVGIASLQMTESGINYNIMMAGQRHPGHPGPDCLLLRPEADHQGVHLHRREIIFMDYVLGAAHPSLVSEAAVDSFGSTGTACLPRSSAPWMLAKPFKKGLILNF